MKTTRFALLAILLLTLTGCEAMARAERKADAERRQRCTMDYGFQPQTFEFGQCLERQEYLAGLTKAELDRLQNQPQHQPICEGGRGTMYDNGKGGVFVSCY